MYNSIINERKNISRTIYKPDKMHRISIYKFYKSEIENLHIFSWSTYIYYFINIDFPEL